MRPTSLAAALVVFAPMTRRYVRHLPDGRPALPTSIEHLVTIDDLAGGVAIACTLLAADERRFTGRLRYHAATEEYYWDEADVRAARRAASKVGRQLVMAAVRDRLRLHGTSWCDGDESAEDFPAEVARARASELWPDVDPEVGPFGGAAGGFDT